MTDGRSNKVLNGVRVAAFTHFAAGPIAAQYLGALGADVIKVESPRQDLNRYAVRDPDDSLQGVSPYFICTNRNQRSIVLDLKSMGGIEVGQRLIASSDVVLENYRPGVMDKLGIGYAEAKALNDAIIYCSFSAYDSDGPARDEPGQDLLMQAASGLASLSGRADHAPVPVGAYVIDGFTAMQGVIGILAAINHRNSGGGGQHVRTDMMSTALYMLAQEASFVMNAQSMTTRTHSNVAHVNHAAPYGIYETQDDPLAISVFGGPETVRKLAQSLSIEDEIGEYLTERKLRTHRDDVANAFARRLKTLPLAEATRLLKAAGAWVSSVNNLEQALADPAVTHSGIVREYDSAMAGKHKAVTEPLQMSTTPLSRDIQAPDFGEHTEEILVDLGYGDIERGDLLKSEAAVAAD